MDTLSIAICSDSNNRINPSIASLLVEWLADGFQCFWGRNADQLGYANVCFGLSYSKVVNQQTRAKFKSNLVVHESDLPHCKGWSPLSWQILEGKNTSPIKLIEPDERVDSGVIYAQDLISFEGYELLDELRAAQSEATHQLCRWFVDTYPQSLDQAKIQSGKESFYSRRQPKDSQLNPDRSLRDQFDLLRIADNEHYPAFFELRNHGYRVSIEAMDNE